MSQEVPDLNKDNYPSIELAYDLSVRSYDWAVTRLLNAERRVDTTLRLGLTGTAILPTIAFAITRTDPSPEYINLPGFIALLLAFIASTMGIIARRHGEVAFINPKLLYDNNHLADSCEQFQVDVIYAASEDFLDNVELVRFKSTCADVMAALYGVEILFGIWWLFLI